MDEHQESRDEVSRLAPRLFAVCELERDDNGALTESFISAWGMEFAHEVQWISPGGYGHGRSDSTDKVMRLLGRGCEARLMWT
jgi:hypothetical protein